MRAEPWWTGPAGRELPRPHTICIGLCWVKSPWGLAAFCWEEPGALISEPVGCRGCVTATQLCPCSAMAPQTTVAGGVEASVFPGWLSRNATECHGLAEPTRSQSGGCTSPSACRQGWFLIRVLGESLPHGVLPAAAGGQQSAPAVSPLLSGGCVPVRLSLHSRGSVQVFSLQGHRSGPPQPSMASS